MRSNTLTTPVATPTLITLILISTVPLLLTCPSPAHAAPFPDIHKSIFPFSVARFTRNVFLGRPDPSPNSSLDAPASTPNSDSQPPSQQADEAIASPPVAVTDVHDLSRQSPSSPQQPNATDDMDPIPNTSFSNNVSNTPLSVTNPMDVSVDVRAENATVVQQVESVSPPVGNDEESARLMLSSSTETSTPSADDGKIVAESGTSQSAGRLFTSRDADTTTITADDIQVSQNSVKPPRTSSRAAAPVSPAPTANSTTLFHQDNSRVTYSSDNNTPSSSTYKIQITQSPLPSTPPPPSPSPSTSPPPKLPGGRRVFTTNVLPDFRQDKPSQFPPGFGDMYSVNRTIVDVGANNGDEYTLLGALRGHTVIAFEPSPTVISNFKRLMVAKRIPLSVISLDHDATAAALAARAVSAGVVPGDHYTGTRGENGRVRVVIPRNDEVAASTRKGKDVGSKVVGKVYLMPFALSNETGTSRFFESRCKASHCGKVNRIPVNNDVTGNIVVAKYRLDDLILPVDIGKLWLLKVDVEGHELEVLQGARNLLRKAQFEYIALEFSPNGRDGIQWGVDLLEELYDAGYTCFHFRGFGQCHDESLRSPSLKCNFPFPTGNASMAPTFKQYAEVFRFRGEVEKKKPHMADLMFVVIEKNNKDASSCSEDQVQSYVVKHVVQSKGYHYEHDLAPTEDSAVPQMLRWLSLSAALHAPTNPDTIQHENTTAANNNKNGDKS